MRSFLEERARVKVSRRGVARRRVLPDAPAPHAKDTPSAKTNAHPPSVAARNTFATPPLCEVLIVLSTAVVATAAHANAFTRTSASSSNPPASIPGIALAT